MFICNWAAAYRCQVQVILPSSVIRRELACYEVARHLDLSPSTLSPTDLHATRCDFRDSVYYSDPFSIIAPKLVLNLNDSHYDLKVGDAVQLRGGGMGVVVSIACQNESDPMQHTINLLPLIVASSLSQRDRQHARHLVQQSSFADLSLDLVLVAVPHDSQSLEWNASEYQYFPVTDIDAVIDYVWDPADLCPANYALLLQQSSVDDTVECINICPFLHSYSQRYVFPDNVDLSLLLMMSLYVDGFRTWVSRSGNVTAVYMSLSQMPLHHLNKAANVHLISLIPSGGDEAAVLRMVSRDIDEMARNGLQNVWIANGPNREDGSRKNIHVILAFVKGDTPQRASYTNTVGASGNRPCHSCAAGKDSIADPQEILTKRRSKVQFERIQAEYLKMTHQKHKQELRQVSGYAIAKDIVSVLPRV
jgi:hypothetical protein